MGFVRNKIMARVPGARAMGRLTDLAIVSGAGLRFAHRKGLVSDEMAARFGAVDSSGGTGLSSKELLLVGAAAVRLLGKAKNRK